jgi:hypothetical protein
MTFAPYVGGGPAQPMAACLTSPTVTGATELPMDRRCASGPGRDPAMAEYDRPVGIGHLVTVDTTRPVAVAAVAGRVRACLAG